MNKHEYGAFGCTVGVCVAMIAALGLVAAISIVQGKDEADAQKLREQASNARTR